MEVGGDRDGGAVGERGQLRRARDEAGEADKLRVELLVERAGGLLGRLDGLQRARDVAAEGVVLRGVNLTARREEDDQQDADCDGGRCGGSDRVAESRPPAGSHRERDEEPEDQRPGEGQPDQLLQVRRDRIPRLVAHVLEVERTAAGDPGDHVAIDRAKVHIEPDGQADRVLEPHAPVHERDVEVERPMLAGIGGQLDLADGELLLLVVRVDGGGGADEGRDDDGTDDRDVAQRSEEPTATLAVSRLK